MIVAAALVVVAILVPPLLFDLLFRPAIRRIGLRNAARRPGEAALVVAGSLLATALITSSLLIGDSFESSVRSQASTLLGPIDQIVTGVEDPGAAALVLEENDRDGVFDGILPVRWGAVSAGGEGANPVIVGDLFLLEAEPRDALFFGLDPSSTGLVDLPRELAADEAAINTRVAAELGLDTGDQLRIYLDDGPVVLDVVAVLPRRGLAGFGDVLTAPRAVTRFLDNADDVTTDAVLVSNTGDDFGGVDRTDEALGVIRRSLAPGFEVNEAKRDLLREADADGEDMTELFGTVGGFSVAAGVLLLVNLFVMLATERRRELGIMAAIGFDRSRLRRSFSLEGAVYGVVAAAGGTGLGVAVAAVVTQFAAGIFRDDADFELALAIEPSGLIIGALLGFAISQLTVTVTSSRLLQMDIPRSLADSPTPTAAAGRRFALLAGGAAALLARLGPDRSRR